MQRLLGNGAVQPTPAVKQPGDGHDLKSARFAGDPVLEAVYDNERTLKLGDEGEAVLKVKQALADAGFPLPDASLNEKFDPETEAAVERFQRASGMTGTERDGVVGASTLGWLDQRFSEGASAKGTTPGATMGCPAIRTLKIDIVSLDGSTRDPQPDLVFANTVFSQCCVRFVQAGGGRMSPARTREVLGGDLDLRPSAPCHEEPTVEEIRLWGRGSADFNLSSPIRVFYVASTTRNSLGYSFPQKCAVGLGRGMVGMAVVANSADARTLAHELGHILFNAATHPEDTNNLMRPSGTATGEQLTPEQCAKIK
jgi:hypothetical protein